MLLHDKLRDYRLILASASPRRRELIAMADLPFTLADKFETDESFPDDLPANDVPIYIARNKSEAYPYPLAENDILITADTVVILNNEVLGKPKDMEQAKQMVRRISGTSHEVVTGVVIRTYNRCVQFDATSKVWLRQLTDQEIDYYVTHYSPLDKAGAYGIQEWIGCAAIERIEGSFYNVMGLPIQRLYQELKTI